MSDAATEVTEAIVDTAAGAPADDTGGMDMDAAVSDIASGLGLGDDDSGNTSDDNDNDAHDETTSGADDDAAAAAAVDKTAAAVTERPMPKSWAKDSEDLWKQTPDAVKAQIEKREQQMLDGLGQYKEYSEIGKSLKAVIDPHQDLLTAHGIDAPKAVSFLLSAHRRLTTGSLESRQAAYAELGKNVGLSAPAAGETTEVDPEIKALKETVGRLESTMTERQQKEYNETRTKVASEVTAFAEANPYFDEVADDMTPFLKAGADLKTAYDKAVWANPVTRAKELARTQSESETNLRKKAKDEAEAARKASGTNVRTRDSNRSPTEKRAKLFSEDHDAEMREVVRNAGKRTH